MRRAHDVLPELRQIERVIAAGAGHLEVEVACRVAGGAYDWPVHVLALGTRDPKAPALGLFGGVHGLERIGSRVVIAYLQHLVARLRWDDALHDLLDRVRLVFMPLVNPVGMARGTRSNGAGVDLMRNAPVDAQEAVPLLVGGQRLSAMLPWFRGRRGAAMEPESSALCEVVRRELHARPFSMALDCHSGFGMRDRLWFPFAHRATPFAGIAQLHALCAVFGDTHPHHPYLIEPQSRQYLAHGDLWDHLYLQSGPGIFLPLTLEMGSWLWVKKNPRQLFTRGGIFNPLIEHREHRVLRRHMPLLEFALHATASWKRWTPREAAIDLHREQALQRWYGGAA